jgi:hypothetical protein
MDDRDISDDSQCEIEGLGFQIQTLDLHIAEARESSPAGTAKRTEARLRPIHEKRAELKSRQDELKAEQTARPAPFLKPDRQDKLPFNRRDRRQTKLPFATESSKQSAPSAGSIMPETIAAEPPLAALILSDFPPAAPMLAGLGGFIGREDVIHGTAEISETPDTPPPDNHPPPNASLPTDPVTAIVAEFNARYMVVSEAGKALIYEPIPDTALRRRYYSRITFDDLKRLYLNRRVHVGKTMKSVADVWLHHPDRRQYIGGIIFDPSGRDARPNALNLWQGFAVEPRPQSWARMQDHILDIVCAGNTHHRDWLVGWMARLMQRPGEQGEVAVVMRGIEGTGKGTLAKALLHILGQHGMAISNARLLTGNFNGHLRDTVLLFADEAFFAGDRAHVGVLKALISEATLAIEAKFQNAVQMPNFIHLMMASNETWVVPASLEARRFFVLEVSPRRANDHDYFAAIWEEMERGGYEAMLHDLLAYDLAFFNHRAPPRTDGLQEQKKLSLPAAEDWWRETLHREYVHKSRYGLEEYFSEWHEQVATEILFDAYTAHARARGERHPMGREAFGAFMVHMGAKATRPRNVVTGEHVTDVENSYGGTQRKAQLIRSDRAYGYNLGILSAARDAFERATGLKIEWPKA